MLAPARVAIRRTLWPAIVIGLGVLTAPATGDAQARAQVSRIGILMMASRDNLDSLTALEVFRQALRELGHVEGQNIAIEYRWAQGRVERFPELAAELVRLKVDLIVVPNTPGARAARQATATIPIVAWAMHDPVGDGLVQSLGRPGGNVTGLTFLGPALAAKHLQLFTEAIPTASRLAALWHPRAYAERTRQDMAKAVEGAARARGVKVELVEVVAPDGLDGAFSGIVAGRAEGLIVLPSPMFFAERRRIVQLAARHRLPAMYGTREFVDLGGLMAYGANLSDLSRRGAALVDRILKGARPADLPVEQPTTFELAVNLKTARALGITIPQSVLLRADAVIQ